MYITTVRLACAVSLSVAAFGCLFVLCFRGHGANEPRRALSGRVNPEKLAVIGSADSQQQVVEFRVINDGTEAFNIREIKTSCSCTVARPPATNRVEPGSFVICQLRVNVPGYGVQSTSVEVLTEPPLPSILMVMLHLQGAKADVPYVLLAPKPRQIVVDEAGEGVAEVCDIFTVEASGSMEWITGCDVADADFSCELLEVKNEVAASELPPDVELRHYTYLISGIAAARAHDVKAFTVTPLCAEGRLDKLRFGVRVSIAARFKATPSALFVDGNEVANAVPFAVQIVDTSGAEVGCEKLNVIASAPFIAAECRDTGDVTGESSINIVIDRANAGNIVEAREESIRVVIDGREQVVIPVVIGGGAVK